MGGATERALDRRVVWIWRARALAATAALAVPAMVLAAVAAVSGAPAGVAAALPVAVLLVGAAAAVAWPQLSYAQWRYVVDDDWLELRHGVVVRSRSWVPWFRIQHVDVEQGPLERRLGIVHLVIHTASASTDATIPGISGAEAEDVRSLILSRVGGDDAV